MAGFFGSIMGSGGSVTIVSKAGVVSGLGATGITSGLSSVGSMVGGGMAAGLGVVVVIPVVAGSLTYLGYKYFVAKE